MLSNSEVSAFLFVSVPACLPVSFFCDGVCLYLSNVAIMTADQLYLKILTSVHHKEARFERLQKETRAQYNV